MTDEQKDTGEGKSRKRARLNEKDREAIENLKKSAAEGKHWYISILEAVKIWSSQEEDYQGRHLRYLIDNEAFDWLLLVERLADEIADYIPEDQKVALLFFDKPPLSLSKEDFKKIIGTAKYKAYLNYTYGVLVEEALVSAVVDEVRKEKRSMGSSSDDGVRDKAFKRIYGGDEQSLLQEFLREKRYYARTRMSLSDMKEFYYWLFKYRIKRSEKPKVASDTRKALLYLQHIMEKKGVII
jgi:hypothetical protein